ncbi:hypothetical protein B4064_1544 [Caldibacillus thermoamylovorans]|nr:hypothetical protein B4064_1544 [Caldibacillus thermoamylovorans]
MKGESEKKFANHPPNFLNIIIFLLTNGKEALVNRLSLLRKKAVSEFRHPFRFDFLWK